MFTVRGPRADRFIELLARHSGLRLSRVGEEVRVDPTLPGNPYCSETLQALVENIVANAANIEVTARGDVAGGFIDSFFSAAPLAIRSRTAFVRDLEALERHAPELAAAMMAHFLAEYFHAATRGTPRQFANAHVAGLLAEARTVRDLTGRPIFEGSQRPWERTVAGPGGRIIAERRYGPGNVYRVVLGPLPALPIISVSHP